jgi:hypothetical protein
MPKTSNGITIQVEWLCRRQTTVFGITIGQSTVFQVEWLCRRHSNASHSCRPEQTGRTEASGLKSKRFIVLERYDYTQKLHEKNNPTTRLREPYFNELEPAPEEVLSLATEESEDDQSADECEPQPAVQNMNHNLPNVFRLVDFLSAKFCFPATFWFG